MRSPSGRVLANTVDLYAYTPSQDVDAGTIGDGTEYALLASGVACSAQQGGGTRDEMSQGRNTQVNPWTFIFGSDPGLNINDKIIYLDGAGTHTVFVNSTGDQAGRESCTSVTGTERA